MLDDIVPVSVRCKRFFFFFSTNNSKICFDIEIVRVEIPWNESLAECMPKNVEASNQKASPRFKLHTFFLSIEHTYTTTFLFILLKRKMAEKCPTNVKAFPRFFLPFSFSLFSKKNHLKRNFTTIHLLSCISTLRNEQNAKKAKAEEKNCFTFTCRTITTEFHRMVSGLMWTLLLEMEMVLLSLDMFFFISVARLRRAFFVHAVPFSDYLLLPTECDYVSPKKSLPSSYRIENRRNDDKICIIFPSNILKCEYSW